MASARAIPTTKAMANPTTTSSRVMRPCRASRSADDIMATAISVGLGSSQRGTSRSVAAICHTTSRAVTNEAGSIHSSNLLPDVGATTADEDPEANFNPPFRLDGAERRPQHGGHPPNPSRREGPRLLPCGSHPLLSLIHI